MKEITIRPWEEKDSVDEITEVLHLAYGALARQRMHYNASHQPPEQTLARLSSGDSFIAITESGKIVGTITLYKSSADAGHKFYTQPVVAYFGQFAVHPEFQGVGIAKKLFEKVEDQARSINATVLALDTAETAHELIATYRRWGFAIVDRADWDSTNYVSVIMAKPLK